MKHRTQERLCWSGGKASSAKPQSAARDRTLQRGPSDARTTQLLTETTALHSQPGSSLALTAGAPRQTESKSTVVPMKHRHPLIKQNSMTCLNGTAPGHETEDAAPHSDPIILRGGLWHAVHVASFPFVPQLDKNTSPWAEGDHYEPFHIY